MQVLATQVSTWSYIAEGRQVRHLGPVAEDFFASFGLGPSSTSIGLGDMDGVNFMAVKALEDRTHALPRQLDAKDAEVARLRATVTAQGRDAAELRAELDALRAQVQALAAARRP